MIIPGDLLEHGSELEPVRLWEGKKNPAIAAAYLPYVTIYRNIAETKTNVMPNPVPKKRECKFCGAPYYFQNNKVMYCSEKCRVYAWREKRRGKHKAKRARRSELTKLHEKRKRK